MSRVLSRLSRSWLLRMRQGSKIATFVSHIPEHLTCDDKESINVKYLLKNQQSLAGFPRLDLASFYSIVNLNSG